MTFQAFELANFSAASTTAVRFASASIFSSALRSAFAALRSSKSVSIWVLVVARCFRSPIRFGLSTALWMRSVTAAMPSMDPLPSLSRAMVNSTSVSKSLYRFVKNVNASSAVPSGNEPTLIGPFSELTKAFLSPSTYPNSFAVVMPIPYR